MSKVKANASRTVGESHCVKCGKWVQFETKPAANSIDIGGPAVALNCGDPPRHSKKRVTRKKTKR